MLGNLLESMAFERLDQVGHGLGYQKSVHLAGCSLSSFSHLDIGFRSYSPFVLRAVICDFP
ncbi:hypothetical protein ACRRTK_020326 [Alexandromys fortis]